MKILTGNSQSKWKAHHLHTLFSSVVTIYRAAMVCRLTYKKKYNPIWDTGYMNELQYIFFISVCFGDKNWKNLISSN